MAEQLTKTIGDGAVGGSSSEDEEQHLHDLRLAALMNPLILNCIFSKLDMTDLKTIRQVCSLWGDVGASALGDKTMIKIYEDRPIPQLNDPSFNLKLAKTINFSFFKAGMSKVTKLIQVFGPIDSVVEYIFINTTMEFMSAFVDAMDKYEFPNLDSICVFSIAPKNMDCFCVKGPDSYSGFVWRTRPTVRFGRFVIYGPGSDQYHSILQSLVNSSPNMEQLEVIGNLYPDLSRATKLKTLNHGGHKYADLAKIKEMLTSARKTIVNLHLGTPDETAGHNNELLLPVMPNLASLNVSNCDMYRVAGSVREDVLPKLKHFRMSSPSADYTVQDFLAHLPWKRHKGIVSLQICTDAGPDLVKRVVELFPNVEKLDAILGPRESIEEWKEVVKSYGSWKNLTKSIILCAEIKNVAQIKAWLEGMSIWKGSKSVDFVARRLKGGAIKRFTETTKAAFLLCEDFENVTLSGFKVGSTALAEEMKTFIKENKLPIYFEKRIQNA